MPLKEKAEQDESDDQVDSDVELKQPEVRAGRVERCMNPHERVISFLVCLLQQRLVRAQLELPKPELPRQARRRMPRPATVGYRNFACFVHSTNAWLSFAV